MSCFMQPAEHETVQQIPSKELTEDKKLLLSNDIDDFKEIIASSIQSINFNKSQDKLNALNKALRAPVPYPSNYVFASFSEGIYKNNKELYKGKDGQSLHGKVVYPELGNWQLLTVGYKPDIRKTTKITLVLNNLTKGLMDNPNGYCGAAYWNPDTQQVIIVHSVTNNKDEWDACLYSVFLNEHVAQIDSAITFTDKIIYVLKEINKDKGSNIQLFITGYSLGAWLAPITAFSAKYLKKRGDNFVANDDFEGTGYHASAVIFDGPGCELMLRHIQSQVMSRYGPSFINSLDIINYLSAPNVINACNPQVGEVYRLFINLSPEDKKHLETLKNLKFVGEVLESIKKWSIQKHIVVHTVITHRIASIKEVFDPRTGEVFEDNGNLRIEKVVDWPLLFSGKRKEVQSEDLQRVKWIKEGAKILGKFAAKVMGITILDKTFQSVSTMVDVTYGIYKSKLWYNEFVQELDGFLKLADASNNYRLENGLTCSGANEHEIRYHTTYLGKNYKNERSLNVFSQPERKFLEEYKFLERYHAEFQGIVILEKLFYSFKNDKKLMSRTRTMLKGYTVRNGTIHSKNLQEFIPYIKHMLHLFPEMKQTVAEMYKFLPSYIHNKLYQLISSSYLNSIKNALDFNKDTFGFKIFLEDTSLQILHMVQSCSSLAATRIYKTFSLAKNNYTHGKHHAFLNLDRIFYLGEKIFISFLKKINYNYLLVIECDDVLNEKIKGFFKTLFETLQNNRNGNAKHLKVVLATEKGSDFSRFIRECVVQNKLKCREENCEVKFNDLTSDFQRELLEKTVIFQGREVHLSTVINGLDAIIDSETIVELLKNKRIEIGKALPLLGETQEYYIDRALVKKVKVDEKVLRDESLTDLFAISNISEGQLSSLVNGAMIRNFRDEDPDTSTPVRFIILNEDAENNYKNLCDIYSNCTIHGLKNENDVGLIWKKSYGKTLSGLRKYIENYESDLSENEYSTDNKSIKIVGGDDICKFNEKFVVIAAEPGMGKTTSLTRLGTQRTDNCKWFIRINLVECKDKLEQINFNEDGSIVAFLHGDDDSNTVSNILTKKLLESRLNNNSNIVLLLDGFDEITSKGQRNVVNLLKKLRETPVQKVLISTRLHLRNELENSLSTVAYTFKPFSKEDQKGFLNKFWQKDLAIGTHQGHLDNYINELLKFLSQYIGDKERKFMGIPLQMRMIAEAFQEVPKNQALLDHPEFAFPKNFDMLQLYDRFVVAKYQIYFRKKGADLSKSEMILATKGFNEVLMHLAIKNLFPNMENIFVGKKLPSEDDKQVMSLVGIAQFINGRTVFTHRSFEEYFFSSFLANILDESKQKYDIAIKFLAKELFESKNEVIKTFLDYRLAKAEIHVAVLKGKLNDARNMLSENGENIYMTDDLGRSALHYAAQEGHREIVDILLKENADIRNPDELGKTGLHYAARYNNGEQVVSCLLENAKDCINNKDKNGRTAVYYAAQRGSWDIVDRILKEEGVSVEGLDTEKLLFHYTYKGSLESMENILREKMDIIFSRDNHNNTLLHIAAQKGYITIVEFLLEKGINVAIANNSGKRPISYAAEKEHWIIVESLLRKNAKFDDLADKQKFLLLYSSAENAHWDIVKLFMEDNGRDNYFRHLDSKQRVELLFYFIRFKDLNAADLDIAEFFIEKGVEISSADQSGKKLIHYATENEYWNIVENLLRKDANLNDLNNKQKLSLLKHSSKNTHWDIVKLFMKDTDREDYFSYLSGQQGIELLCYCIRFKDFHVVKFLIKKNTEVNSSDGCNKKPMYYAVEHQYWDIVELLLRNNASFSVLEQVRRDSILDHFVQNSNWDIVKLFMEGNHIDSYFDQLNTQQKVELLVYLAHSGSFDLAKLVIERGAQVNIPDNNSKKPINYAAKNGHWKMVELLLRNNAEFNDLENAQKDSLLHYSAERAGWDIVKLFMEHDRRENYFDQLDDQQRMYCVCNFICVGNLGVTKFFVEQLIRKEIISSINVPNNCGETFLHLAAKNGKLDIAQYLINEKKADLTVINADGKSPKDLATERFHTHVVKFLEQEQQERLFDAAKHGNLGLIQTFVNQGVSVNVRDNNNWTLLHSAIYSGRFKLVEYLIEKGADVLAKVYGDTVLHFAVIGNKEGIMKLVLDKIKGMQRNINQHVDAKNVEGDTPLIQAARYGEINMAQILLEYEASIGVKNNKGMMALHYAAKNGYLEVAKLLVENEANIHAVDNNGRKPIHVSILHGHRNVIELFLSRGVSVEDTDQDGWSLLHYAAKSGYLKVAKLLVEKKANIHAVDNNSRKPIHVSALYGHRNVIELFLSQGVSIEDTDQDGWSLLHYAACNKKSEIMYFLLSRGANIVATGKKGRTAVELAMAIEKIKQWQLSCEKMVDILDLNSVDYMELDTDNVIAYVKQIYDTGIAVHPDTLRKSYDTAIQLYSEGQYKESLKAFKYVFSLQKRADSLGPFHLDTLLTLTNIAVVLSKLCKYEEALETLEEVLDLQRESKYLGSSHNHTNHCKAAVLYKQGKYKDALQLYAKVFVKRKETLGANHPDTLITRHHIARVINNQGDHNRAYNMFCDVYELQCHILGADHTDTLRTQHNIAFTLYKRNKYQDASKVIQVVLEKRKKVLGSNHPDTLTTQHVEALILLQFDRYEKALNILKGIFHIQEKILGLDHSDTLETKHNIAYTLYYLHGESQESSEICHEVYEKRKEVLGSDHPYTLCTYNCIQLIEPRYRRFMKPIEFNCRSFIKLIESKCNIQYCRRWQAAFLDLSRFVSDYIPYAKVVSVKQGLYLSSFQARKFKINGRCAAITRSLSQALLSHNGKLWLNNLESSAEIYERIAIGKQISKWEEIEVFAFSRLLSNFDRQLDSSTNSLPSSLIFKKGNKTFRALSNYIAGIQGDFAIHLVTSDHVVAIYRISDNYAYFDSNVAFISGLKRVDQLMQIVEKAVKFAGYKVEEKVFLVEHFDALQANWLLSSEDKQILVKEIETERQLLAAQDEELDLIKVSGHKISRVQLYDFGTKINVRGSVPLLINADMNLSNKKFQDHLSEKEVSITAREYVDHLKNSNDVKEVIQATKAIPFMGSKHEIEEAEQMRASERFLFKLLIKVWWLVLYFLLFLLLLAIWLKRL